MAVQAAESIGPQTDGAQREPSMEEILASIRRIIEDSDQVHKPDAPATATYDESAAESDMRSFSAELNQPADAAERQDGPTSESAQVDQAHTSSPLPNETAAVATDADAPGTFGRFATEAPAAQPHEHESEPRGDKAAAPRENNMALDEEMDVALPAAEGVETPAPQGLQAAQDATGRALAPAPAGQGNLGSIISEQAGRQVSAAFDELSEVFAAGRRRSFDEIAAEMMRPMLQEWLDNNLPTLVERLVREEIERVARGHAD
ncbi:PopZ family protein [Mesorhizobium xinjiangense]|uniref:PopZ family protein n=1 Tax=Mesorhizobium xinjiangense TaxID=2678685 RepID=UPI0012EDC769|nr:DUF2497 domain-containing protein [Mesorhizobium xinjiangense]